MLAPKRWLPTALFRRWKPNCCGPSPTRSTARYRRLSQSKRNEELLQGLHTPPVHVRHSSCACHRPNQSRRSSNPASCERETPPLSAHGKLDGVSGEIGL